jgi:hypothetical protein
VRVPGIGSTATAITAMPIRMAANWIQTAPLDRQAASTASRAPIAPAEPSTDARTPALPARPDPSTSAPDARIASRASHSTASRAGAGWMPSA